MPIETVPFDFEKYLTDLQDQADLVTDAFATGDAATIREALNIVARARGITAIAADAGLTRMGAYKALGPDCDPRMSTLLGLLAALGFTLAAVPVASRTAEA